MPTMPPRRPSCWARAAARPAALTQRSTTRSPSPRGLSPASSIDPSSVRGRTPDTTTRASGPLRAFRMPAERRAPVHRAAIGRRDRSRPGPRRGAANPRRDGHRSRQRPVQGQNAPSSASPNERSCSSCTPSASTRSRNSLSCSPSAGPRSIRSSSAHNRGITSRAPPAYDEPSHLRRMAHQRGLLRRAVAVSPRLLQRRERRRSVVQVWGTLSVWSRTLSRARAR
jgi:hypothetical protein